MSTFLKRLFYPDAENPASAKDEQDSPKKLFKYRVLVVDDEEPMRRLIADLLSDHGHQCMTANNGKEALDQFNGNTFDAVITDIGMPEMDGIALTRQLSSLCPNLPIMIMTGDIRGYLSDLAITAGAWDFIGKPFAIDEFILRFTRMMDYCCSNQDLAGQDPQLQRNV
jgi:CheY-like chemotaxis protein